MPEAAPPITGGVEFKIKKKGCPNRYKINRWTLSVIGDKLEYGIII